MKKLLCMLLAVIMALTFCSSALAETLDLSSLTDEEVADLYAQLQDEMIERDMINLELYSGTYLGGDDLPAGRYVVSAVELYEGVSGPYVQYTLYEFDSAKNDWEKLEWVSVHAVGEKMSFRIKEGQQVKISNGVVEVIDFKAK